MIELKLYLYDSTQETNGYRGTDLSRYILMGTQNTEDLTQVVDITEITLAGYPTGVAFAPETMFVLDEVEDGVILRTFHRVVKDDYVSQPILSRVDYFDHSITLTEPSVIAQKRIVDNMAITYKLKDVSLVTIPSINTSVKNGWAPRVLSWGEVVNSSPKGTRNPSSGQLTFSTSKNIYYLGKPAIFNSDKSKQYTDTRYIDFSDFADGKAIIRLPIPVMEISRIDPNNPNNTAAKTTFKATPSMSYKIVITSPTGVETVDEGTLVSNQDLY